jgi:hypothetical protein
MPSISKKYSRKRNNRKRGHSRRRMRRKSRHASYYRRRRNMFGGKGGTYHVDPYDADNDSDNANLEALNKLMDCKYLGGTYRNYFTNEKFTDEILDELSNTFNRIKLPDTDISLQKIRYEGGMVVEVKYTKDDALIGIVKFRYKPQ